MKKSGPIELARNKGVMKRASLPVLGSTGSEACAIVYWASSAAKPAKVAAKVWRCSGPPIPSAPG